MKKLYILLFTILISGLSFGQTVFINEIHYDNAGGDLGEGVEIAGPAGTDLSAYSVTAYNGNNGASYITTGLSGIIPDEGGSGYGAVWFAISGLQNGAPDGIALDNGGTLIQFLSYEGSFAAADGPANGVTSTDIGVAENSSTPSGNSLQLTGTGTDYANFSWTAEVVATTGAINTGQTFGTPMPSLSISDGPANGSTNVGDPETVNNADIDFTTTNFVMSNDAGGGVSDNSGDGYIKWTLKSNPGGNTIDSGNVFTSNDPLTTYPVNGLVVGQTFDFRAELVDNTGAPLSSPVVYSFTVTIATYNDVNNLAELRLGTVDPDTYYRVINPVVNTYTITSSAQSMYFQDGTAGILVYDPIYSTSTYNTGDAVSNIRGHLETYNGVLELVPSDADWGAPSTTGNVPSVSTVTISTLLSSWENYESELVKITNATFADGDGINTFSSSTNYNITDVTGTMTFRTAFTNANYIGQTIPSGNQDLVVIVAEFSGTPQVTSRSLADITLDSKSFEINGFAMYPNPTSLGYVTISSKNSAEMRATVFDMLGKQVLNETISHNKLNVSSLTSGVYIMKVSQKNAITTRKLVIQ